MNESDSSGLFNWINVGMAAVGAAVTVGLAWFNDRMSISRQISQIREDNAKLEAKFDMFLEMYMKDHQGHGE